MTARALVAVAAAGLLATACTHSGPELVEPADPDPALAAEAPPASDATDPAAADAERTCRAEATELDRRDGAGLIDWEAIEGPEAEPTEEELESVVVEAEPVPGDVMADGERPTFPDLPDQLDVATLTDLELVEAVEICYEVGVLVEEEPTDDEDDEAG